MGDGTDRSGPADRGDARARVRQYVLEEFLPGESPAALDDRTPLISGGILDSIATVKLVMFLERQFGVELKAHEMSADHLDTIEDIARTVDGKRAVRGA